MNNTKDTAVNMMQAGFRVFPLLGAVDHDGNKLDPKESHKRPWSRGWKNTPATWSDEQLDTMDLMGQFATGYGVLCDGLIVIDVDARNGGVESYDALVSKIPELENAGLTVATGSGGGSRHVYFKAPADVSLQQHLDDYPGIDFKTSGFVVGPASLHSSGNTYQIIDGNFDDVDDAPATLVTLLERPAYRRVEYDGSFMDVSENTLADMLDCIPNDDLHYDDWVEIGMAIHHTLAGHGFELWDNWSRRSAKYDDTQMDYKWQSFGDSPNPKTIGTLIFLATQNGYTTPVTFESDTPGLTVGVAGSDLLDTSWCDLLRPPDFVGEVKEWIDTQCRFPREHLAVAGALVSVGNVAGLRYTDDVDGASANMFAFCVADSSSGKEAVLQACQDILVEAGVSAAAHGYQKSQQEVTRNLIRHQPAYYLIDEIGIELKKATNATRKGGAAHLEGLIGALMSFYGKANGRALLSGDVKEDMRKALQGDYARVQKQMEDRGDEPNLLRKAARIQGQLETLDQGLDRPFLSLMGFTTPSTFDDIIDADQAASGFVGRALLIREHESNPRPKRPFKKAPFDAAIKGKLMQLYQGGSFDAQDYDARVEHIGPRIPIRTTPEAIEALHAASDWIMDFAEDQKEITGLEPVVRRGYELIAKVSLILAVQSGIRTLRHVQWAYALVQRDINEKLLLVLANDTTRPSDQSLMANITKVISSDHGETFGVIKNKLRRYKPEDVKRALEKMVENGICDKKVTKHPKNGREVERFFFTG